MLMRPLSLGLVAGALVAAPVSAQTLKYRVAQKTAQDVDLSGMGQPAQHQDMGVTFYLTYTVADTAGGRSLHAAVDSVVPDSSVPAEALPQFEAMKGARGDGVLDGSGKLSGFDASESSMAPALLKSMAELIFPRVKQGTKPGDAWTDTTDVSTNAANGTTVSKRRVTNYQLSAGDAATEQLATAYSFSLTGTVMNGMGTLSGTGTGNAAYRIVKANGRVASLTVTENSDNTITTPQAPIKVTSKTSTTATLLQ